MPGELMIHVNDAPGSERAHLAFRFGLVALAEHRAVTILLSAAAVELATARSVAAARDDHGSVAAMVERFVDNGGRLWLLNASVHEHGLTGPDLVDGAAIVSPGSVVDELVAASGTLTF